MENVKKYFWSSSLMGFFLSGDENIPLDAVEITKEYYNELIEGSVGQYTIRSDENGYPVLVNVFNTLDNAQIKRGLLGCIFSAMDAACIEEGFNNLLDAISYINSSTHGVRAQFWIDKRDEAFILSDVLLVRVQNEELTVWPDIAYIRSEMGI